LEKFWNWADWSQWSECLPALNCQKRYRRKECKNHNNVIVPNSRCFPEDLRRSLIPDELAKWYGRYHMEFDDCVDKSKCVIKYEQPNVRSDSSGGQWESWQPWSECTKSCQGGERLRKRSCVIAGRKTSTDNCAENLSASFEIGSCNNVECYNMLDNNICGIVHSDHNDHIKRRKRNVESIERWI